MFGAIVAGRLVYVLLSDLGIWLISSQTNLQQMYIQITLHLAKLMIVMKPTLYLR